MDNPGIDTLAALPTQNAIQTSSPELWGTLLRSFGMLLVVLGILILVLWLIRRYSSHQGYGGQQGIIRMVASMYVAPKERIALVDVLGKKLLIGITSQQISFLARIEDDNDICDGLKTEVPGGFFKALLKRRLQTAPGRTKTKGDGD